MNKRRFIKRTAGVIALAAAGALAIRLIKQKNGRCVSVNDSLEEGSAYFRTVKPVLDVVIGIGALVVLMPVFILIAAAIFIDDPGPILFRQKRIGQKINGELTYFEILKFRTMKTSTPKDVPTHLLSNPEQYITRVGKILRRTSLDELPQLWNIAIKRDISLVGPRPALWNQDDLVAEREKYGANDIKPGLTGWAQINGRDELEISKKAALDGYYTSKLKESSLTGFLMDIRCFTGTILAIVKAEGVHEGGPSSKEESA